MLHQPETGLIQSRQVEESSEGVQGGEAKGLPDSQHEFGLLVVPYKMLQHMRGVGAQAVENYPPKFFP